MTNAASGAGGESSAGKAADIPAGVTKVDDQPSGGKEKTPGGVSSGFKDPLPPGTESKSGPGSDGPV